MTDEFAPPTPETVAKALRYLPAALVASAAGVRDVSLVDQWLNGTAAPSEAESRRLQMLIIIGEELEATESRVSATSWLTTANPALHGDLPVKAIREDRHRVTLAVAQTDFLTWKG